MTAADEACERHDRRAAVERRLHRVESAIRQWHAWDTNQTLPPDEPQPLPLPPLALDDCLAVRQLLRDELKRLSA
jgi:hypothetical protein